MLIAASILVIVPLIMSSCATRKNAVAKNPQSSETVKVADDQEIPFTVVEEMPQFPGGDSALLNYLVKNITYPAEAKAKGIQGQVIARFCINSNGSVDRISVLKEVSPELDNEAIRVIKSFPAFKPGKQGGKQVPVWFTIPISFKLD